MDHDLIVVSCDWQGDVADFRLLRISSTLTGLEQWTGRLCPRRGVQRMLDLDKEYKEELVLVRIVVQ